jgi:hypothetical protein
VEQYSPRFIKKGDRRGSNPRPSEPQSEPVRSREFTGVQKPACLGGFLESAVRWRSPTFARVVVKTVVRDGIETLILCPARGAISGPSTPIVRGRFDSTNQTELRFHALLTENGTQEQTKWMSV